MAREGLRAGKGLTGCCASKQMVRQFSTNGHCCSCRLHPANITTVGWDWTRVKFIMEHQVLGTLCHMGQGSYSTCCPRVNVPKCFLWLCSAAELASPTASASWESHIYPQRSLNPLHSFRQVVPLKKAQINPLWVTALVQCPSESCLSQTAPPTTTPQYVHQYTLKTASFPGVPKPVAPPDSCALHLPPEETPWLAPLPAVCGTDPGG